MEVVYTKEGVPLELQAEAINGKVMVLRLPKGMDTGVDTSVAEIVDRLQELGAELVLILDSSLDIEAFDETNIGIHPKILKRIMTRLLGVEA